MIVFSKDFKHLNLAILKHFNILLKKTKQKIDFFEITIKKDLILKTTDLRLQKGVE
jgi:hypothetical protein